MATKKKVQKVNKKTSVNVIIVVVFFVLLAVVAGIINQLSKKQLRLYEVQSTGLAQDNIVTGLILRDEAVIKASHSGYINYYTKDAVRIGKGSLIFSLDETKEIYDSLVNANISEGLSDYDRDYIKKVIADYRADNSLSDYSSQVSFTEDINEAIHEVTGSYSANVIDSINLAGKPSTFHTIYSGTSGLISFNSDSYSGITLDKVDASVFEAANNYKNNNKRKALAAAGDPVAKLITSDTWQLLCPLNASQAKALAGLKTLPVTICEDGMKLTLPFTLEDVDGVTCALFTLDSYIQNYLDSRFLSVSLNWEVSKGYKIPLSSITEKTFYIVPTSYFSKGGNSNNLGLIKEITDSKGNTSYSFTETTIYHNDGMYYYIDASDFTSGDIVRDSDNNSYTISLTEKLEGVYNINKGYAVFRRIERITQNDEYCIVQMGTPYGIALYDHIVLNASDAVDSGIIY